ncbi:MAG: hypothetical protein M3O91_03980, partial [Chloroflexota bacterium]|nr:hypothetical protein [Chloroflexota bacterium]
AGAALAAACSAVGRDPATLRLSHWSEATIGAGGEGPDPGRTLAGDADQLLAALAEYAAAGVAEVQLALPYGQEVEMTGLVASQVVPRLP